LDAKFPDAVKRTGSEIGLLIPPTGINKAKSVEDLMNPVSKKILAQYAWGKSTLLDPWYWHLNNGFMNFYPKTPADIEAVIS